MCHNCLSLFYIKMCKSVLSKTEFMLFAVKLENISQDKNVCFYILVLFQGNSIFFWFDLEVSHLHICEVAHHDLFIHCILYIESNIKFWLRSCVYESSWRSDITFSHQLNILSKCVYCEVWSFSASLCPRQTSLRSQIPK